MLIRKASGEEMLKLWGYQDVNKTSPTAKYLYHNISSENAILGTLDNDGELIGELYVFFNIEKDRDFADGISTAYLCAFRVKMDENMQPKPDEEGYLLLSKELQLKNGNLWR